MKATLMVTALVLAMGAAAASVRAQDADAAKGEGNQVTATGPSNVTIPEGLAKKLAIFLGLLEPAEREAMIEILRASAPPGAFLGREEWEATVGPTAGAGSPADAIGWIPVVVAVIGGYGGYAVAMGAGVAGHLSGGGTWSNVPWQEIRNEAARYSPAVE